MRNLFFEGFSLFFPHNEKFKYITGFFRFTGTIILDTVNMSPSAKRTTQSDIDAILLLENNLKLNADLR